MSQRHQFFLLMCELELSSRSDFFRVRGRLEEFLVKVQRIGEDCDTETECWCSHLFFTSHWACLL